MNVVFGIVAQMWGPGSVLCIGERARLAVEAWAWGSAVGVDFLAFDVKN
jgi:hypothetical protein